jgi:hypothetical protein
MESGAVRHNFEMGLPKDYPSQIWFNLEQEPYPFLAHLAEGHVSFCHHLASVVRPKLSHLNLLL